MTLNEIIAVIEAGNHMRTWGRHEAIDPRLLMITVDKGWNGLIISTASTDATETDLFLCAEQMTGSHQYQHQAIAEAVENYANEMLHHPRRERKQYWTQRTAHDEFIAWVFYTERY